MNTPTDSRRPAIADLLGGLALVPFVAGAAAAWLADPSGRAFAVRALVAYAATVVSFIGALHWGFAIARRSAEPGPFVWGVLPAIVGWIALLVDPAAGLAVDALLLVACWLVDRTAYPRWQAAGWLPFRTRLTVVATACCVGGALAAWH